MAKTVLYLIESKKYFDKILKIAKGIKGHKCVYLTTNKPAKYLITLFQKQKINPNNFFFIDCISQQIGEKEERNNIVFIQSPKSLTTIGIAVNESIKQLLDHPVLILDSLSILLLYNDAETIGKFSNFLVNKMRQYGVETVILALESDVDKDIIKTISTIVDEVKEV